jgi:hypothetical protein
MSLSDNPKNCSLVVRHDEGSNVVDVELIDHVIKREIGAYDGNERTFSLQ